MSPACTSLEAVDKPTTAGRFKLCASRAVWLVLPPTSVQKPKILCSCKLMVSEGYKLCATSKDGFCTEDKKLFLSPDKLLASRLPTSNRSLRRSLKNGSSILWKEAANSCNVNKMAAWAESCSCSILCKMALWKAGSCKISLCVDIKLAYSAPNVSCTLCSHSSNSAKVCRVAWSNLAVSAGISFAEIYWRESATCSPGSNTAGPIATPGLAAIPFKTSI